MHSIVSLSEEAFEAHLWEEAQALCAKVPKLTVALEAVERLPARTIDADFSGLVRTIIGQQVSVAAARAIYQKLETGLGEVCCEAVLRHDQESLAKLGLSRPKGKTLCALSHAVSSGELDFEALSHFEDDAAREALCRVKGIGPWTADVFLLFALRRPDVWPHADLALQKAAHVVFNTRKRPDGERMVRLAKAMRPRRAIAARLLWAYYNTGANQPLNPK